MATKTRDVLDELSEPLTMMAAAAAAGGGGQVGFPAELVTLLQRKLAKELKAEENQEQELRRLLEARSKAFKEEIEGRKRAQEFCPHRKEDNRSRVGGQRLSDGSIFYMCQFCGKEWKNAELPPALAIPLELIGG